MRSVSIKDEVFLHVENYQFINPDGSINKVNTGIAKGVV